MENQLSALSKLPVAFISPKGKPRSAINSVRTLMETHMPLIISSVFMFTVNHKKTPLKKVPFSFGKESINKVASDLHGFLLPFNKSSSRVFRFLPLNTVVVLTATLAADPAARLPSWWLKVENKRAVDSFSNTVRIIECASSGNTHRVGTNMMSMVLDILIDEDIDSEVSIYDLGEWITTQRTNVKKYMDGELNVLPVTSLD